MGTVVFSTVFELCGCQGYNGQEPWGVGVGLRYKRELCSRFLYTLRTSGGSNFVCCFQRTCALTLSLTGVYEGESPTQISAPDVLDVGTFWVTYVLVRDAQEGEFGFPSSPRGHLLPS